MVHPHEWSAQYKKEEGKYMHCAGYQLGRWLKESPPGNLDRKVWYVDGAYIREA
jgi:hypothetical protein